MPRRFATAVIGLLSAGALVLSGMPSAHAARPTTEAGAVPIPQRYLTQQITWEPCSFDARVKELSPGAPTTNCAKVTVPMDWRHPDAHPDIQVAIAYSKATGNSRGLLTTNPGGPGGPGLSMSASLAVSNTQWFTDYDLLGFDPRGFGQSTTVPCQVSAAELAALPVTPDYRERTALTHEVEYAEAKLIAKACSASEVSQFISTQQTVYDMDFLRALLKYQKLNFVGYSYGTWLGTWYADTFPARVDRFVIDSNMEWTDDFENAEEMMSFAFQRRRDAQLFPWIARNDATYHLGTTAKEVAATYEKTRAALAESYKAGTGQIPPDTFDFSIVGALYSDANFPRAAALIADPTLILQQQSGAGTSKAAMMQRVRELARHAATVASDEMYELGAGGMVVRCNDTAYKTKPAKRIARADQSAVTYPFMGYADTVGPCSYWPFQPQSRTIDLAGSPQLLMIQAEGDPATATEGALDSHRRTRNKTILVAVPDEGQHGIYNIGPSQCVDRIVDNFLFEGVKPRDMTVCGTSPLPGDSQVYPLAGPFDRLQRGKSGPGRTNPMLEANRKQSTGI